MKLKIAYRADELVRKVENAIFIPQILSLIDGWDQAAGFYAFSNI